MNVPSRELTPEDPELIEFARQIMDANTDRDDGSHDHRSGSAPPLGAQSDVTSHGQNTHSRAA